MGKVIEVHKNVTERKDFRKGDVLIETPMFEVIRKRSSINIEGEFYPVHLVEEIGIKVDWSQSQNENRKQERVNIEMEKGRTSDDCLDEDDDSSAWSEQDSMEEKTEGSEWDYVPETPLQEITEKMDEEIGRNENAKDKNDMMLNETNKENWNKNWNKRSGSEDAQGNGAQKGEQPMVNGTRDGSERDGSVTSGNEDEENSENGKMTSDEEADPIYEKEEDKQDASVDDTDPFALGPIIEEIMDCTRKRMKFRKFAQKHALVQRTRFEKWREFVQGMSSGGRTNTVVRRGKFKGKRGRKSKNKATNLD